jgi:hypothetical protein
MRVERIDAKRCFVASNKAKKWCGRKKTEFLEGLAEIEKELQSLSKFDLDKMISPDWPSRLKYDELVWYFKQCSIDDLGV